MLWPPSWATGLRTSWVILLGQRSFCSFIGQEHTSLARFVLSFADGFILLSNDSIADERGSSRSHPSMLLCCCRMFFGRPEISGHLFAGCRMQTGYQSCSHGTPRLDHANPGLRGFGVSIAGLLAIGGFMYCSGNIECQRSRLINADDPRKCQCSVMGPTQGRPTIE